MGVSGLKEELNEIEIRMEQQLHELRILKKENKALRKENLMLKAQSPKLTTFQTTESVKKALPFKIRKPPMVKNVSYTVAPDLNYLSPVSIQIAAANYNNVNGDNQSV